MGACASKPKDLDKREASIPEAPVTPKKPDVEMTPEENKDGEGTNKEEPLVDLSEPAPEAPKAEEVAAETKLAAAEVVPEPTSEPAVEEKAAGAIEEEKASKVEEKKGAVAEVAAPAAAEVKTEKPVV